MFRWRFQWEADQPGLKAYVQILCLLLADVFRKRELKLWAVDGEGRVRWRHFYVPPW